MRYTTSLRPEECASKRDTRPQIRSAYLDTEAGTLASTDSYALVEIPVEVEPGDVSGLIPAAALALGRKLAAKTGRVQVRATAHAALLDDGNQVHDFARAKLPFPPYSTLFPKEDHEYDAVFSINVKLLLSIAKAMGTDLVTIGVTNPKTDHVTRWESHPNLVILPAEADKDGVRGLLCPLNHETKLRRKAVVVTTVKPSTTTK